MIPKKREEHQFVEGAGRPYEMNPRVPIEKTTEERLKPVIIHLGDLNGQTTAKGMPKHFHPKRGRTLMTFTHYWSSEEIEDEQENAFDIE